MIHIELANDRDTAQDEDDPRIIGQEQIKYLYEYPEGTQNIRHYGKYLPFMMKNGEPAIAIGPHCKMSFYNVILIKIRTINNLFSEQFNSQRVLNLLSKYISKINIHL